MTEHSPNEYPEVKPELSNLEHSEATSLTTHTLYGIAEEFALAGRPEEEGGIKGLQNRIHLENDQTMYVFKYQANSKEDYTDVADGQKAIDILVGPPAMSTATTEELAGPERKYEYADYYFVPEGQEPELGGRQYRLEKHVFTCTPSDLLAVVKQNHDPNDPDYQREKALGLLEVSEVEATGLISTIKAALDQERRDAS